MKWAENTLKAMDSFSPLPAFNVAGKDRVQSIQGGVCNILALLIVLAYFIYAVVDYFEFVPTSIVQITEQTLDKYKINVKENSKILPIIMFEPKNWLNDWDDAAFYDDNDLPGYRYAYEDPGDGVFKWIRKEENFSMPLDSTSIYDFFKIRISGQQKRLDPDTKKYYGDTEFELKLIACSSMDQDYLKQTYLNYGYVNEEDKQRINASLCIDVRNYTETLTLNSFSPKGDRENLKEFLTIEIAPCDPLESDVCNTRNANSSLAQKLLRSYILKVGALYPIINPSNFKNPVDYGLTFEDQVFFLDNRYKRQVSNRYKLTRVIDSMGVPVGNKVKNLVFSLDATIDSSDFRNETNLYCEEGSCDQVAVIFLYSSQITDAIIRNYKEPLVVLGSIGGLSELILTVFLVLYTQINELTRKRNTVLEIYGFKSEKSEKKGCCKKSNRNKVEQKAEKEALWLRKEESVGQVKGEASSSGKVEVFASDAVIEAAYKNVESTLDVFTLIH